MTSFCAICDRSKLLKVTEIDGKTVCIDCLKAKLEEAQAEIERLKEEPWRDKLEDRLGYRDKHIPLLQFAVSEINSLTETLYLSDKDYIAREALKSQLSEAKVEIERLRGLLTDLTQDSCEGSGKVTTDKGSYECPGCFDCQQAEMRTAK